MTRGWDHDHRLALPPAMVCQLLLHLGLRHREDLLRKARQAVFQAVIEEDQKLGSRLAQSAVPPGDSLLGLSVLQHWEE